MGRSGFAQVAQFNGVELGGLQSIDIEKGYGEVASGALDGMQGADFATAKGAQFLRGTVVHQDVEKMITLLTTAAVQNNSYFYEKEAGLTTFTKHSLGYPVFGALNFSSGAGRKAQVTQQFRCMFEAADDHSDVHGKAETQALGTKIVPVSVGEPIALTFDPGGTEIAIARLKGFDFAVGGEFVTDSAPGGRGETDVEFRPGRVTFSVTYRDADLAAGLDLAEKLFDRTPAALKMEMDVKQASTANTFITLANAHFTAGPRRSSGVGFTEFTLSGLCDWALGTQMYELTGTYKIIDITAATFPA